MKRICGVILSVTCFIVIEVRRETGYNEERSKRNVVNFMTDTEKMDVTVKIFDHKTIRSAWDDTREDWYFSVVDVVGVLSDSVNPTDYLKKMRKRDPELGNYLGTNCPQIAMLTETGKMRKTLAANAEQLLRIIQSIPSPKAEPFKIWLAQVGAERIAETVDPELTIERALETYLRKGYSREWINQRLQAIQVRKELTDEWQIRGVKKGIEYAILTDEITRAWSGMSTKQYKRFKGLKKENLRDNMSTTEIVLNMLAETSATDISKAEQPDTFSENQRVARMGGEVAGIARQALEARTGKTVITSKNAADMNRLLPDIIGDVAVLPDKQNQE